MNEILFQVKLNEVLKMISDFLECLPSKVFLDRESKHTTEVLLNRIEFIKKEADKSLTMSTKTETQVFSSDEIEMITAALFPQQKPAKEVVDEKQKEFDIAEKALKEAQYEVERIQSTIEKLDKMQEGLNR